MKPTKLLSLAGYALLATGSAVVTTRVLVGKGYATPLSPLNLSITLVAVAVVLVLLAIPMMRYRSALKDEKRIAKRVPPFYAFRAVVLAKSTAITGSLFLGWHLGVLLAQLDRPEPQLGKTIAGLAASILATAAGVIVERLFRIPPDQTETPAEGTPA